MKTSKGFLAGLMMLLLAITFSISPLQTKAQGYVDSQYFYDNLAPYGNWVDYPGYGNVWIPDVEEGFRPYVTNGHWVFTDAGWMWASDYDWGWAPFHYGRWAFDRLYGWMWVPGYEWAPAWVSWGTYQGYYGWAPMGPRFAYANPDYPPMDFWVFCHPRYMNDYNWHDHYYGYENNHIAINNTYITQVNNITIINNTNNYNGGHYNAGPSKDRYERDANTKVKVVSIRENANPGKPSVSGNEVHVYRPKVNTANKISAKPSKVVPLESLNHINGTNTGGVKKGTGTVGGNQGGVQQRYNGGQSGKQGGNQQRVNGGQSGNQGGNQQRVNGGQGSKQGGNQQRVNGGPGGNTGVPQQRVNGGQGGKQGVPQQRVNGGQGGKQGVTGQKPNTGGKQVQKSNTRPGVKKEGETPPKQDEPKNK